jgi:hypothetical protein
MGYVEGLLAEGEVVVVRERQHWLATLIESRFAIFVLIVAIAVFAVRLNADGVIADVLDKGGFGLVVIGLLWITWGYLKWHNQQYLVTNRRVIKVEGVLNKHTADSSLEKINDAELDQNIVGRLLNFGDLDILTAAETEVDRFRMLRDPIHFKREMLKQKHELEMEAMRPLVSPPLRSSPAPAPMAGAMAGASGGPSPAGPDDQDPPARPERSANEITQTLAGLADLRDRGAISTTEYEAKKADLLGRL